MAAEFIGTVPYGVGPARDDRTAAVIRRQPLDPFSDRLVGHLSARPAVLRLMPLIVAADSVAVDLRAVEERRRSLGSGSSLPSM
jgi:hypothetical protein